MSPQDCLSIQILVMLSYLFLLIANLVCLIFEVDIYFMQGKNVYSSWHQSSNIVVLVEKIACHFVCNIFGNRPGEPDQEKLSLIENMKFRIMCCIMKLYVKERYVEQILMFPHLQSV